MSPGRPEPRELWDQANAEFEGGDQVFSRDQVGERYRELMRQHGHIVPGRRPPGEDIFGHPIRRQPALQGDVNPHDGALGRNAYNARNVTPGADSNEGRLIGRCAFGFEDCIVWRDPHVHRRGRPQDRDHTGTAVDRVTPEEYAAALRQTGSRP